MGARLVTPMWKQTRSGARSYRPTPIHSRSFRPLQGPPPPMTPPQRGRRGWPIPTRAWCRQAGWGEGWSGQRGGTPAPKQGGNFREAVTTDPDTFDPHVPSNPASSAVFSNVYSTLLFQDLDNSYKPLIAERVELGQDN